MQERSVQAAGTRILLLGSIPGYVPDGRAVAAAMEREEPSVVALGVPPEDVEGLRQLATVPDVELPEPDEGPARLLHLLERFGPTRIPSPDLEAAFGWADAHGARVEALDLDDEAHADAYIRHNRFFDVIRGNRLQRRLLEEPFEDAADVDELALRFDAMQNSLPSLRRVEAEREAHMARRIRDIAAPDVRIVAVLPLPMLGGVADALARPDGPG